MADDIDDVLIQRLRDFYGDYPPGSVAPLPSWGIPEKVAKRAIRAALKDNQKSWVFSRDRTGRMIVRFLPLVNALAPGMLYGINAVFRWGAD